MARRKREIPTPPAMLRLKPKRPHRVERGVVVQLRYGRNGELSNDRAIVMGNVKPDDYSRAYGREVYICELSGRAAETLKVARDMELEAKHDTARKLRSEVISIDEKNVSMLEPVGRVKKIPRGCLAALKDHKKGS